MKLSKETRNLIIAGLLIGAISALLVLLGNPRNMGFCNACFLRDIAGGLGLHRAEIVQYIRPEIAGLVAGSFALALFRKEFKPRGGSAPVTRFFLGFAVMIGGLMFLGCPYRMILRMAGGDLNALVGLVGFVVGILAGIVFLKQGYSLKRTYAQPAAEGAAFTIFWVVLFALLVAVPGVFFATAAGKGPGAQHAPVLISAAAGLVVGALAQRSRFCMIGGIRDLVLFKRYGLILGFVAVLVSALVVNLIMMYVTGTPYVQLGFTGQPIAHSDGLWNFLGLALVGYASVLLGGCPLRQLILAGEGNVDSAITVFGLIAGAAAAHNFGLAASGNGPTDAGRIAVIACFVVVTAIASYHTFVQKKAA